MTSRQDTGTSPLVPLDEDQSSSSQAEVRQASPVALWDTEENDVSQQPLEEDPVNEDRLSALLSYTPLSTPLRPYRYSDHIHQDRHIFLKGATLGIGCGPTTPTDPTTDPTSAAAAPTTTPRDAPLWRPPPPPWTSPPVAEDLFVDGQGRVFCRGRFLGMAVDGSDALQQQQRLPAVHRMQLALPSTEGCRHRRPQDPFPHVHPHHQPASVRCRRPFNEQLNTYVDTQKRIRSVQCLDDLYRATTSPVFPYLATPSPRRPRPPPPPPAKIRVAVPRGAGGLPPSLSARQPPPSSSSLGRPGVKVTARPSVGGKGTGEVFGGSNHGNVTTTAAGPPDPDLQLARARDVMHEMQQASTNQNYADYFLAKEGRQGTLGRLFDSYPKRVLVHPARLLRQRTDIATRARLNILK